MSSTLVRTTCTGLSLALALTVAPASAQDEAIAPPAGESGGGQALTLSEVERADVESAIRLALDEERDVRSVLEGLIASDPARADLIVVAALQAFPDLEQLILEVALAGGLDPNAILAAAAAGQSGPGAGVGSDPPPDTAENPNTLS